MLHVGHENYIAISKIIAIKKYTSAPVRRHVSFAREQDTLLDMTEGKRILSVIYLDNGVIAVSSVSSVALKNRLKGVKEDA